MYDGLKSGVAAAGGGGCVGKWLPAKCGTRVQMHQLA